MGVKFTEEQQAVIDARDCNILVSAAAGSGKTAVLVERIIKLVNEGLDIDHLLVVTFTKAAAAQMREKITLAIVDKLKEDPENKHLQKQETLIHNAQITTIDSFCQYVIKNNFNFMGIDPQMRVGDDGEFRLLQDEIMQDMLEEEYEKAKAGENKDFIFCTEYFGTGRDDKNVEEYIYQLYRFSMSMPWPEKWVKERAKDYDIEDCVFDELDWVKDCVNTVKRYLSEAANKLEAALLLCNEPDGPYMYGELLEAEKEAFLSLLKYDTYDELYDRVRTLNFGRLPAKKDDSVDPDKKENAKKLRDEVKDIRKKLLEKYLVLTSDIIAAQMKLCDRAVKELCRLTVRYIELFDAKKKEMQLIDFSDMEHYALNILVDGKTGEPTPVAVEYRSFFKEVLIDEYQDSNNVQEMILKAISGEEAGISERFMVGDVKQSIYKFRLARPEIFMEKFVSYDKSEGAKDRRIDLHKNFRSRKEVLNITNYIFRKIMGNDLGGVDYDKDAELVHGLPFDEPVMDITPELIFIDDPEKDCENEAYAIGKRIKELMLEDSSLSYKDIVILLRSPAGWDEHFKKVLELQGIPVYTESKKGYFDAWEVSVMLDMLTAIDNPTLDIPIVSVMHSCIGDFSDEELAELRIVMNKSGVGEDSFYLGMKAVMEAEGVLSPGLFKKAAAFVGLLEECREMSTYTPVHELLQYIIDKTGFEVLISAMPAGGQRRANIELLLSKAEEFEKTSFKGLFHFVRYIENIKVVQVDFGEAGIIDENADVVRIMSIHKSKGLEFPVVFVAGLSKMFNKGDSKGDLISDVDLGIGVKCIDSEHRVKYDTLKRIMIADKMTDDCLGEELRVLYVALTRAKEKLIMTANVKKLADEITAAAKLLPSFAGDKELLPFSRRSSASSYLDLVLLSVIAHPAMGEVFDKLELDRTIFDSYTDKGNPPDLSVRVVNAADFLAGDMSEDVTRIIRRDAVGSDYDNELADRIKEKLDATYSHDMLRGLFTKTTVTELKKHLLEEEDARFEKAADAEFIINNEFKEKDSTGLTGAERGTAYHRIMELLDESIYGDESFMTTALDESRKDSVAKYVYKWLRTMVESGKITDDQAKAVRTSDIAAFLSSSIGQRMGKAFRSDNLMREKPFMLGVSASELDDKFPGEEMVLVQGIIDAWFMEDDGIILLDYKTDRARDEKELTDKYKIQLDYYKRALESATGKKVKEKYIYSFALGKEIKLS